MKIIAITGSIGSGKTTLANIARSMGYGVYYADAETRRLYYKKEFIDIIKNIFPEVVENGRINKRALRNIVFNDNKKLKELENIIHPLIKRDLKKTIRKRVDDDILFIDIAILFEIKWDIYCDLIILTTVDKNIQKQRVIKRDNISTEDFDKIVKVQMKDEDKIKLSDVIIDTNQSWYNLKWQLINILNGMK